MRERENSHGVFYPPPFSHLTRNHMKKKVEKDLFPDLPLYPHLYLHGGWFLLFTLSLSASFSLTLLWGTITLWPFWFTRLIRVVVPWDLSVWSYSTLTFICRITYSLWLSLQMYTRARVVGPFSLVCLSWFRHFELGPPFLLFSFFFQRERKEREIKQCVCV